ncbi:MAG: alpha-ketoacid dehydrogenase subunit beta [Conexivisphaera sp.]
MVIRTEITYAEAIRQAIAEEMRRDPKIFIMGEDISADYYMMNTTWKLIDEFGPERVRDTPVSESAFTGAALGAALLGFKPIVEIMFNDILTFPMDQIVNQIAKARYVLGGQVKNLTIVIRTRTGSGKYVGAAHSQSWEAWFAHVPGLVVAVPSTAYDAKGMLKAALRGNDPVMFFEHKLLYGTTSLVPDDDYVVPLGKADIKKEGNDVTLVAYQYTLQEGLKAAQELEKEGISVEVIDPRTLYPLDVSTISKSVEKTGRLVVAHEAVKLYGAGAEIVSSVVESHMRFLKAPPKRVGLPHVPFPVSPPLEDEILPSKEVIVKAIRDVVRGV